MIIKLDGGTDIRVEMDGVISRGLREGCPECGDPDCYAHGGEGIEDRRLMNTAVNVMEALLLALYKSGCLRVEDTGRVTESVQTVVDSLQNNIG